MAGTVTLREYVNMARDANGNVLPAGEEPAVATQTKLSTGTSANFSALNEQTHFVLLSTDGIVNWAIGASPTAATGAAGRLAADEKLFIGVLPGGRTAAGARTPLKIAIITDS